MCVGVLKLVYLAVHTRHAGIMLIATVHAATELMNLVNSVICNLQLINFWYLALIKIINGSISTW